MHIGFGHLRTSVASTTGSESPMSTGSPEPGRFNHSPAMHVRFEESGHGLGATQRRQWSAEEDEAVRELVRIHGTRSWTLVATHLPGRTGKQCRERWHNHLDCDIRKDAWSPDEDRKLIQLHQHFGNRWADISKYLHGRTDNAVKNHWNSALRRGQNIAHLLVDGKLPDGFPNGIPPVPAPAASTVEPSSNTITHLEAAKINNLLRASPNSSLAQLVQYPVSEGAMPSCKAARESLGALLAMLRASSPHELLDATQRLQNVIGTTSDEGVEVTSQDYPAPPAPPPAAPLPVQHSVISQMTHGPCDRGNYAPAMSSRLNSVNMGTLSGLGNYSRLSTPHLAETLPSNLPSARYIPELHGDLGESNAYFSWSSQGPPQSAPDTPNFLSEILTPITAQQIALSFPDSSPRAAASGPPSARQQLWMQQLAPHERQQPQSYHASLPREMGIPDHNGQTTYHPHYLQPPQTQVGFVPPPPRTLSNGSNGVVPVLSTGSGDAHKASGLRSKRPRGATDLRVAGSRGALPAPISSTSSNGSGVGNTSGTFQNVKAEQGVETMQRYKEQLSPVVSGDLGVTPDAMLDFLQVTEREDIDGLNAQACSPARKRLSLSDAPDDDWKSSVNRAVNHQPQPCLSMEE